MIAELLREYILCRIGWSLYLGFLYLLALDERRTKFGKHGSLVFAVVGPWILIDFWLVIAKQFIDDWKTGVQQAAQTSKRATKILLKHNMQYNWRQQAWKVAVTAAVGAVFMLPRVIHFHTRCVSKSLKVST